MARPTTDHVLAVTGEASSVPAHTPRHRRWWRRRSAAGRDQPWRSDPAEVARRIVTEVLDEHERRSGRAAADGVAGPAVVDAVRPTPGLAGDGGTSLAADEPVERSVGPVEVPIRPTDADDPAAWSRFIVASVMAERSRTAAPAPTAVPTPPAPPVPVVAPAGSRRSDGGARALDPTTTARPRLAPHRIALVRGAVYAPDHAAYVPPRPRGLERPVDRALRPLVEHKAGWMFVPDGPTGAISGARWIVLALLWVAATAAIVPLLVGAFEATVELEFELWDREPAVSDAADAPAPAAPGAAEPAAGS